MVIDAQDKITPFAKAFLEPENPTHRQYEALRAYFVERVPSAEAAERFGYSPASFRVLCAKFRKNPQREFFVSPKTGPHKAPKSEPLRDQVIALRKHNLSIYDISRALEREATELSPRAVAKILKAEGFARLPRRRDDERPAAARPAAAEIADARELDLAPRSLTTRFGGLFLFLPTLAAVPFEDMLEQAGFPGSKMVPAAHAMRALLALKLFGNARHSHVMTHVFDPGLALFAGLNVIPKRAFLTEYSCRIHPQAHPRFMALWTHAMTRRGLQRGTSFDLDFHTIPFHGNDALMEKHYVSKRSRRQKGVLAFLAQDGDTRVFCYANSDLRKDQHADEILRFVELWEELTGHLPDELIFDSQLTTYENLNRLNQMGISFITLRKRSAKMLQSIYQLPPSAWRRIRLENIQRAYQNPRILDQETTLKGYCGPIRQITITDLGHEKPTVVLTNQLRRSPAKMVGRYAKRMIIENTIEESVDFFHMDALSSAVPMKVNCDLQLTLMASALYRLLGTRLGHGYQTAKAPSIFRHFVEASAKITLTDQIIQVQLQKRAHNPLLLAAGFADTDIPIPWLGGKRLNFTFP